MSHPYSDMPKKAYWSNFADDFVSQQMLDLKPPNQLLTAETRIGTAGSCFAQHISRNLKKYGMNFVDQEPAPELLNANARGRFGYDMYSARYGNIYTSTQLIQIFDRISGRNEDLYDEIWERDGRYFDAFRTGVEPNGLASADDVRRSRADHLDSIRRLFRNIDVFVFTLGLTETWKSLETGAVFPIAPGVQGIGEFDKQRHAFVNLGVNDVVKDMRKFIAWLRRFNPEIKIILTVSPVPLAATASDENVLAATFYSKSVLRSAAEELRNTHDCVDYFPSYEIVTFLSTVRPAFESSLRDVKPDVVDYVMKNFFNTYFGITPETLSELTVSKVETRDSGDIICEEEALLTYAI